MKKATVIAYYLPQFHPTKENNEWWGEGFTEWTNVAKARPLFKGHHQPNLPADLGFYDLRSAETRDKQAELAKRAGVDAFCYWHYWFGNGRQLLEKPLQLVVETGHPDFPFCLGWANHSWFKKLWNSDLSQLDQTLLMKQEYPGLDDHKLHFDTMLPMFRDGRYYKIKGKLVFLIYDVQNFQGLEDFIALWQKLASKNGLPPFYFIGRVSNEQQIVQARKYSLDHLVYEDSQAFYRTDNKYLQKYKPYIASLLKRPLGIIKYSDFIHRMNFDPVKESDDVFPTIYSNWDTSPRRGVGGDIVTNATPELFYSHVRDVISFMSRKPEEDRVIFLKSWNEWAEGNYIEPDIQYGKARIDALHNALF